MLAKELDIIKFLELFNYCLILAFGFYLSIFISGGNRGKREYSLSSALCLGLILLQLPFFLLFGEYVTRQIYPLIIHLPLILYIVFVQKKNIGIATASVMTAYLCCQVPKWAKVATSEIIVSELVGQLSYTAVTCVFFFVLYKYFVEASYKAMASSKRETLIFGGLPMVYYIYDYATTVYNDNLPDTLIIVLRELFPTAMAIFFVFFLSMYYAIMSENAESKLLNSILEAEQKHYEAEIESMKVMELQAYTYNHDMRHHMNVIDAYINSGNIDKARNYIKNVQMDVETIGIKRFCASDIINMICSSYVKKAEQKEINLELDIRLTDNLFISDTEICAIISNGLENAYRACGQLKPNGRNVSLTIVTKDKKLLIEIVNTYIGTVEFKNGIPISKDEGHGYGCISIDKIVEKYRGICSFTASNDIFKLQIIIPEKGRKSQKGL